MSPAASDAWKSGLYKQAIPPKKGEVRPKGRTSILCEGCFAFHAETFFQRPGARKRDLFEPGRPPKRA